MRRLASMADGDNVGIQIVEGVIKLPGVRINYLELKSLMSNRLLESHGR